MTKFKVDQKARTKPKKAELEVVRANISDFVANNSYRLEDWLDEIYHRDGPRVALAAFTGLLEFSVPKLARQEHTGEDGGPVELSISWSTDEQ